eukprot:1157380-Pelagomonas_calceolata.AAC.8
MGPARRVTQINKLDRQTGRQAVLLGLVDAQLFWQLSSTFIHGSISVARVEAGPLNYLCLPWAIGEVKARWESKDRASTGSGTIADPGTFACVDHRQLEEAKGKASTDAGTIADPEAFACAIGGGKGQGLHRCRHHSEPGGEGARDRAAGGGAACSGQDQGRELGDSQVPDVQPVRGPYYPQPRSPAMPSRSSSEPWL